MERAHATTSTGSPALGYVATQHDRHDAAAAYRDATRLAPDRAAWIGLAGAWRARSHGRGDRRDTAASIARR